MVINNLRAEKETEQRLLERQLHLKQEREETEFCRPQEELRLEQQQHQQQQQQQQQQQRQQQQQQQQQEQKLCLRLQQQKNEMRPR